MPNEPNNGYNPQNIQNNQKKDSEIPKQGNFSALPKNNNQFNKGYNPHFANHNFNTQQNNLKQNNLKQNILRKNNLTSQTNIAKARQGVQQSTTNSEISQETSEENATNKTSSSPTDQVLDKVNPLKKFNPLGLFGKKKKSEVEAEGSGEFAVNLGKKIILFGSSATFGLGGCFSLVILVCVVTIILAPLFYVGELIASAGDALSDFGERLGNFLTFRGWCSDSECQETEQNDFYDKIVEVYEDYQNDYNVKLNTSLLTATLTYIDPFTTTSNGEVESTSEVEGTSIGDMTSSNLIDFKKSRRKVELLAEQMVSEDENGNWQLDLDQYRKYLEDEFVRKFYYDNKEGSAVDNKVKQTVNEIFARASAYEGTKEEFVYTKTYAYCSGVTVTSRDGTIEGTYSLEDYVAGVVSAEAMAGLSPEAYKAQAVAARTATLKFTNNCERTIENSTRNQVFKWPANDYGIEAAEATKGQVMIYDGAIFDTQYDSYCYNDKDCEYGEEDGRMYVIYKRLPTEETHKVYLSHEYDMHVNGGHGRGMSQAASYEMADNGYTYEEILKFFYSDGAELANMITVVGSEYISTSGTIDNKEELSDRSDYYAQMGTVNIGGESFNLANIYSKSAGNLGQCVWYAQSRALELIYNSNMDDLQKIKALKAISGTYRNGEGWYDAETLDIFPKVTDHTLPVAGAIVSWSSSTSLGATHEYGHVAIIESVDYEDQTVVISDGWNSEGPHGSETWENVNYRIRTLTFDEILNYRTGYTFNGYVYILGQGETV